MKKYFITLLLCVAINVKADDVILAKTDVLLEVADSVMKSF